MKKKILLLALILISATTCIMAQLPAGVKIEFESKDPTVVYRKNEDQTISVNLKIIGSIQSGQSVSVKVKVDPVGLDQKVYVMDPNPWLLNFGEGHPKAYTLKLTLKKDSTSKFPVLLKLNVHSVSNDSILASHEIFYQPQSEQPKTIEDKVIKSNAEIKADLNSLKAQLLNGDTSRTYIGKIVIHKNALVYPYGEFKNLNKLEVDSLIKNQWTTDLSVPGKISFVRTQTSPSQTQKRAKSKTIDSVTIKITEGMIEYIKVKMRDSSYFTNKRAPIPLLNIENRFQDRLTSPHDGSFIFVKDVVDFIVDQRFNYFPSDTHIYLQNNEKDKKSEEKLFANNGLNSFVDFRVFTDLLAALDNQPNGLLQFEAKSKIYLHRKNITNTFMFLFYGIDPYLGVSKLDSKYDTVKLNSITKTINRMDLYQRSYLNVGLKFNLFRWDFRPSNSFFINPGYQFNASHVSMQNLAKTADSVTAKAIFHTMYLEAGISSKRINGFGFEGGARYLRQLLNDNRYFTDKGYRNLIDFNVTAFYYLGKMSKNKFFVRFNNTLNFDNRVDDFYQLQFGYSLNLKL